MKNIWKFVTLIVLLLTLFIFDLLIGSVEIPFSNIFNTIFLGNTDNEAWRLIITEFRLPKAITAVLVGISLSVSGLQMQSVFRNPLAGPDVLGISSGASLGVSILVMGFASIISMSDIFGNWAMVIAACIGSFVVLSIILSLTARIKDIFTILILGIMFGFATSSIVSILQYFSSASLLKVFIIWTLGSLSAVNNSQLTVFAICVLSGLILAVLSIKHLNLLLLGDAYAKTSGMNVGRARIIIFISTSILAGTATAFCGPIGFIGIAVPHISRIFFKSGNVRIILPASVLIGSCVMLISDVIAQLPGSDKVLPINSVTAIIGVPIIILIILKKYNFSS